MRISRIIRRLIVPLGLAAVAACVTTPTASAYDTFYTYQNKSTQLCMDDSDAFGLRDLGCNGLDYQAWEPALSTGFGNARNMFNENTSLCMDYSDAYGLRAIGCNNLVYQAFYVIAQSDGSYTFQSAANQNICVDDSVTYGLRGFSCNGLPYQEWSAS